MSRTAFALLALLALGRPGNAQLPPDNILARAATRYAAMQSLTANFVQVIENPMLGGLDTTRGVLLLERPNRFALRFVVPAGDRVVIDGTWLWIYLPSDIPNQVLQRRPPSAGLASANLFDQFLDRPRERYEATAAGQERMGGQEHDIIRLTPRTRDVPFREAEIAIGREDGIIRRIDLVELSGQRRRILLSAVRLNSPIPTTEFEFSPPSGARVIRQD